MNFKKTLIALSVMAATSAQAAAPSNEEIWQKLLEMQQQMAEVQQQNQQLKEENQTLKNKIDITEQTAREANETAEALAVSTEEAIKTASFNTNKTTIGGYGELHYNGLDDQNGIADKDEIDFHRFVLYFGHEFSDRLRLFSELEIEHAVAEGTTGAVELEQAYLQYDINEKHRLSAGMFLLPIGLINETHEPTTFYGTERNNVESKIIPTTWWEGGAMFSGELAQGFSYDVAISSGLNTSAANNYAVRNGRGQLAQAKAKDPAYTARLKWTGMPGVELAASVNYQADIAQSLDTTAGSATLFETHAVIEQGQFGLRALYATWDLDGAGPKSVGADEQTGWYIEPSFKVTESIGLFTRYSLWDNQAGDVIDSEYSQWDLGVNWWPHKDVVVKVDYQDQDAPAGQAELDGVNVGLGYQF